jgi:hypothetical protein
MVGAVTVDGMRAAGGDIRYAGSNALTIEHPYGSAEQYAAADHNGDSD